MPTREQLEKLNRAKQKMATGERALRDFVDRPDKKGTANERQTHKDLADQSQKANDEYVRALLDAYGP